jgi:CRP/FNR family transcriptional regulator
MSPVTPFTYEVPCQQCPLRSCTVFRELSDEEVEFVSELKKGELRTGPGATLLQEGQPSEHLFTLLEGWAFRSKTLSDGRRQITNFVLPGDFVGLQGSIQGAMEHSVETLTPAAFCTFPRARVWDLFSKCPSLAFDLTWLAAREERILDENLLSVGRRSAEERTAYYLLHLYVRADDIGLVTEGRVRFPFTQQHLADAIGLSLVHTNKTLKRLERQGLIHWDHGWFSSPDIGTLAELATFDLMAPRKRPLL